MLHLHLLVATCPGLAWRTSHPHTPPVENDFSFSCAWLSERTHDAFDCPGLCAEGGGVPACPADEAYVFRPPSPVAAREDTLGLTDDQRAFVLRRSRP